MGQADVSIHHLQWKCFGCFHLKSNVGAVDGCRVSVPCASSPICLTLSMSKGYAAWKALGT